MMIIPKIIPSISVGVIIIPNWVKIIHFCFIPSKYENHHHGMILESIIFTLKRYGYYTSVFAVWKGERERERERRETERERGALKINAYQFRIIRSWHILFT